MSGAWNKPDKNKRTPHISRLVRRFNLVSRWVATEILKEDRVGQRAKIIKHFLKIANESRQIGNFNGIMEILSGLQNSSIYRLKKTWDRVQNSTSAVGYYNELTDLMSNNDNYKLYRNLLKTKTPPCIPYPGVYLTDLTFVEDGNPVIIFKTKTIETNLSTQSIKRNLLKEIY